MMTNSFAAASLVALMAASPASAIVYHVDFAIGAGTVSGTIETRGDYTGQLGIGLTSFRSYDLTITSPNLQDGPIDRIVSGPGSSSYIAGNGVTATLTTLSFDFMSPTLLIFQGGQDNSTNYICFSGIFLGIGYDCRTGHSSEITMGRGIEESWAEAIEMTGNTVIGRAAGSTPPVVSPATIPLPAAMPLALAGIGALVVAGRRKPRSA